MGRTGGHVWAWGPSAAARQGTRVTAVFLLGDAPDVRVAPGGAGPDRDPALFREVIALVALGRAGGGAFRLLGATAAARVAGAALALLGVGDTAAWLRRRMKEAGPGPRRWRAGLGSAGSEQEHEDQGWARHAAMIPATCTARWVGMGARCARPTPARASRRSSARPRPCRDPRVARPGRAWTPPTTRR